MTVLPSPPPTLPSRVRPVTTGRSYPYLLSRPSTSEHAGKRWPLILFLHGAAERGTEVSNVARQGLPRLLAAPPELSNSEKRIGDDVAEKFIVVAPQCPHYEVWNEQALLTLLREVLSSESVDADRVYLTGLSMGAFGAWSLGIRHADEFAALVPVCGGGRVSDVHAAANSGRAALQRLGVWAFHGAKDRIVPLEESERMVAALKEAGVPDVKLTVYADVEHDAWTPAYADPGLYTWLLRHARDPSAKG